MQILNLAVVYSQKPTGRRRIELKKSLQKPECTRVENNRSNQETEVSNDFSLKLSCFYFFFSWASKRIRL